MAFVKTKQYVENKIKNIRRAIDGNKKALAEFAAQGNDRAVVAHKAYIESCEKQLAAALNDLSTFED